jgi:uncharacterized membrane protein YdbT with pleckstrin-like domain
MNQEHEQQIYAIARPHKKLFWVYFIRSVMSLFMFPVVFVPLYLKFISLRYHIDKEGVGASWGIFFKKQVFLTYARIQDIHLNRSFIERWLGLGTVEVQTASGSATAELSLTGLEEFELVRDFLYSKMRGAKGEKPATPPASGQPSEALLLLHEIRDEIKALRTPPKETHDDV